MGDVVKCNPELHEYQINELIKTKEDHEDRIKRLEENNQQAKMEFALIKKELAEQKALTLDIGMRSQDKSEKLIAKVIESQESYFTQLLNSQQKSENNKIELTKGQIALFCAIVTGISGIITSILMVLTKFIK